MSTSEQDRLQTDIFVDQQSPDDGDISDDEDADSVESLDYIRSISPPDKERDESYKPDIWNRRVSDLSPPGKRRKLRDERSKLNIWNRRFQNPIRQENVEQFKAKVNAYEERILVRIKLFISQPMMICLLSTKNSQEITPNF